MSFSLRCVLCVSAVNGCATPGKIRGRLDLTNFVGEPRMERRILQRIIITM